MAIIVMSIPLSSGVASASPTTPRCATVEYRTEHLAECNRGGIAPIGGGGGQGGGLLGAIRDIVRGVTGGLL